MVEILYRQNECVRLKPTDEYPREEWGTIVGDDVLEGDMMAVVLVYDQFRYHGPDDNGLRDVPVSEIGKQYEAI
jgi:hypothetical protein